MKKLLRDAKGRFISPKNQDAVVTTSAKLSKKAKSQPRDAKGHFIKAAPTLIAVDPGEASETAISVVNTVVDPIELKRVQNTWEVALTEVSEKLNTVIQCINKLDGLRNYIVGSRAKGDSK